ncbi:GntR family transcriptional regulator [Microbacterium sp. YY-01]|uniref:GntR family transcriptional regulator n=1 Tax=Microbacterium sp. YY-01 TaxID=3421634 RepID=UPI003D170654
MTRKRPVRRAGLRDEVYRSISAMLIENEFHAGMPLRVEALAQMLEVSHTPVREALVQLEATGLVDYVANKGYTVAPLPTEEEMRSIMDARLVLEVASARRAAAQNDREFTAELARLIDAQCAAAERMLNTGGEDHRSAVRDYLQVDRSFHEVIFRATKNPFLMRLAQTIDGQAQRSRQSFLHGVGDAQQAIDEHRVILSALEAGDPDAAEWAMQEHLQRVLAQAVGDIRP